jgi:hypothetical protein
MTTTTSTRQLPILGLSVDLGDFQPEFAGFEITFRLLPINADRARLMDFLGAQAQIAAKVKRQQTALAAAQAENAEAAPDALIEALPEQLAATAALTEKRIVFLAGAAQRANFGDAPPTAPEFWDAVPSPLQDSIFERLQTRYLTGGSGSGGGEGANPNHNGTVAASVSTS